MIKKVTLSGLGRMGTGIAQRILRAGFAVYRMASRPGYDDAELATAFGTLRQ